jgi:MHS family proline/betaine transporter-like MFS transporter
MTDQRAVSLNDARRKAVIAGGIGNFVEWFDFGLYAQFATIIGMQFFPSDNRSTELLASFAAFAVGFLARPLGSIIFGHIGDRFGRRSALSIAVLAMSLATFGIGVLPSYMAIGIAAPVLLVCIRLIQGLSAGGEYAGSASFIIEYAPSRRRGIFGAVTPASVGLGTAAGALVGLFVTMSLDAEALNSWGWRIPFLIAGPLGLVGLYLRLRIQDTPEFQAVRAAAKLVKHPPIVRAFRDSWRTMIVVFLWCALNGVGFYLMSGYMVAYNTEVLGLTQGNALLSYLVALVVFTIAVTFAGLLVDRFGRKRIAIFAAVGMCIVAVPSFLIMGSGGLITVILGQSLYAAFIGFVSLVTPMIMVEFFPASVRYTASGLSYNLAYGVLGGTAPLVATWMIAQTGDPISPSYYIVGLAVIAVVVATSFFHRFYDATGKLSKNLASGEAEKALLAEAEFATNPSAK